MTCKKCSDTGTDLIRFSDTTYYSEHGRMPPCCECKNDVWSWIENKEEEDKFIQAMIMFDLRKWQDI